MIREERGTKTALLSSSPDCLSVQLEVAVAAAADVAAGSPLSSADENN